MGSASNTAENYILDAMLGDGRSADFPATVYIALFADSPNDAGGGTEVDGGTTGYERLSVDNNSTNWPAASGGLKSNALLLQFATALEDWGTITDWAIMSDSTAGWALAYGSLASPINGDTGFAPFFAAGDLQVTCD